MRKWVVLAVLLVLVAVAAVLAASNLNRYLNANKQWLSEQAQAALGRTVSFDEIGVSLWGGLGVRVTNLEIAEDPNFGSGEFLRAGNVQIRVKLLPALWGRYEISRIVLDHPVVEIVRSARGLNVSTLGSGAAETQPTEASGQALDSAALLVAYLDIRQGRLRYLDQTISPHAEYTIDALDCSASDVGVASPVRFQLAAAVLGSKETNVELSGRIGPVQRDAVGATPLDVHAEAHAIPLDRVLALATGSSAGLQGLFGSGPVALDVEAKGTLDELAVHASADAEDAKIAAASFVKPAGVPASLRVEAKRQGAQLSIDHARLTLRDASVDASGHVELTPTPSYTIDLVADNVDLRGWDALVPALSSTHLQGAVGAKVSVRSAQSKSGSAALTGSVSVKGFGARVDGAPEIQGYTTTAELSGDTLTLAPGSLTIGGSPAQFQARATNLSDPVISFTLSSPALRAASLGVAGEGIKREEVLREVTVKGIARMTASGPNVRGTLVSARGSLRDFDYEALTAELRYEDRRVTLDPLSMRSLGGTVSGRGVYDVSRAGPPSFRFETSARNVEIEDLLGRGSAAGHKVLEGRLDADVTVSGAGSEWAVIQKGLAGDGTFNVRDGVIRDVNLAEGVLAGVTGVPGLSGLLSQNLKTKYPRMFQTGDTAFDALTGVFKLVEGRLVTDNLLVKAPDFAVRGKGGIGLDRSVDLNAAFEASAPLTKDLLREVGAMKYLTDRSGKVAIPFRLQGTLPAVRPRPDLAFVGSALQRAVADKLMGNLLGAPPGAPTTEQGQQAGSGATQSPSEQEQAKPAPVPSSPEDRLRKGLENLLGR